MILPLRSIQWECRTAPPERYCLATTARADEAQASTVQSVTAFRYRKDYLITTNRDDVRYMIEEEYFSAVEEVLVSETMMKRS